MTLIKLTRAKLTLDYRKSKSSKAGSKVSSVFKVLSLKLISLVDPKQGKIGGPRV